MKKIMLLISLFFLLVGCSINNQDKNETNKEENLVQNKKEIKEEKEEYQDLNPILIALYKKESGVYKRQDRFYSQLEPIKDIATFSIILDNQENISGNYKELYKNHSSSYENFTNYKIGYNISFTLKDGKVFNENILKPKDVFDYSFSDYLYIWLYDDINNTGWYSHLEADDYNETTVMSSIKLMSTSLSKEIITPIKLTVFTYDFDDFDLDNNYRGVSKFTTLIERIE